MSAAVTLHIDPTRKTCSICGRPKPFDEFHRRRHYKRDGHRAACKACTALETRRARQARGGSTSDEERRKGQVRYRTRRLIQMGELVPRPCEVCAAKDVQAHHRSYDGPDAHRDVQWLCPLHHAQAHGVRSWTKQMDLFPVQPTAPRTTSCERAVTYRAVEV